MDLSRLAKAMIVNTHSGKQFHVMYNPEELRLEQGHNVVEVGIPGLEAPPLQYVRGKARSLSMELFFDTYETGEDVRRYTDDLAAAVRSTGATQPIFYNGWSDKEESVAASSIEGCSFGWYPTGLISGGCLRANYLPAVDDYPRMRLPC